MVPAMAGAAGRVRSLPDFDRDAQKDLVGNNWEQAGWNARSSKAAKRLYRAGAEAGRRARAGSGRNIARHLPFEQSDLVLQKELAFLESLQLELILRGAVRQLRNYVIEI